MWILSWTFKLEGEWNLFAQFLSFEDNGTFFVQFLHEYCLSSWILRCSFNEPGVVNLLSHFWEGNEFSPVCFCSWFLCKCKRLNFLSQNLQGKRFSSFSVSLLSWTKLFWLFDVSISWNWLSLMSGFSSSELKMLMRSSFSHDIAWMKY